MHTCVRATFVQCHCWDSSRYYISKHIFINSFSNISQMMHKSTDRNKRKQKEWSTLTGKTIKMLSIIRMSYRFQSKHVTNGKIFLNHHRNLIFLAFKWQENITTISIHFLSSPKNRLSKENPENFLLFIFRCVHTSFFCWESSFNFMRHK